MHQLKYFYIIFLLFYFSGAYSQKDSNEKVLGDTIFENVLKEGNLSHLLSEVPNRPDLQLERLAAYFFHQRINQYRLDNGLSTLYWDDRMWLAARNHNLYMIKHNASSHQELKDKTLFTGINPWDRIQYVMYNGFKMKSYSENILMNYSAINQRSIIDNAKSIADESFEQWKNSPPHNKNMLNPDFFAHGTSFYRGNHSESQVFGTTNFGNASDFEVNEIAISWNDSLAKRFPPSATKKRKPFVAAKWTVMQAEKELFNVVKARMPKHTSAYNADFTLAAELGIKNKMEDTEAVYKPLSAKQRYLKVAKDSKSRFMLVKLHEKTFSFKFSKEQLTDKSALYVIDQRIAKELPPANKITSWGGKCILSEKETKFVCEIDLIYVFDN